MKPMMSFCETSVTVRRSFKDSCSDSNSDNNSPSEVITVRGNLVCVCV